MLAPVCRTRIEVQRRSQTQNEIARSIVARTADSARRFTENWPIERALLTPRSTLTYAHDAAARPHLRNRPLECLIEDRSIPCDEVVPPPRRIGKREQKSRRRGRTQTCLRNGECSWYLDPGGKTRRRKASIGPRRERQPEDLIWSNPFDSLRAVWSAWRTCLYEIPTPVNRQSSSSFLCGAFVELRGDGRARPRSAGPREHADGKYNDGPEIDRSCISHPRVLASRLRRELDASPVPPC